MGNIPLPALDIKPIPQPEDPLTAYAKLVAVRSQMQNQQLRAQQIQGAQQENQMRAMQLQDQQKIRQVASDPSIDWTKPDAYDKLIQKASQSGVSPQSILPLQQHVLDMRQKLASTDKATLENQVTQNDMRRGKLLSIVQEKDPALKQSVWEQEVAREQAAGTIQPGQVPTQYPGDDVATRLANSFAQGSVLAKEAISKQSAISRGGFTGVDAQGNPVRQVPTIGPGGAITPTTVGPAYEKQGTIPLDQQYLRAIQAGDYKLAAQIKDAAEQMHPKQMTINPPSNVGTWQLQRDDTGKVVMFNSKTGETKDAPAGLKPKGEQATADEKRRADLAVNMKENLDTLEDIVRRRPELFGPGAGWLTAARGYTGLGSDPDIAALRSVREYLGMASVGAHAMRNAQHVGTAADAVMNGYRSDPATMMGAIKAARKSLETFQQDVSRGGAPATTQAAPQKQKSENDPLGIF